MKLDRNVNPSGRGKYALIELRKGNPDLIRHQDPRIIPDNFKVSAQAVNFGGPAGEQFFVMKYKDRFVGPALRAYAAAVRQYATGGGNPPGYDIGLMQYAAEIELEAEVAERFGTRIPD